MARIRTIKPDFFEHEGLQDLEIRYPGKYPMFVFAGLWGHCDKNGVFRFKPRTLKLKILPFINFDMPDVLGMLIEEGYILKSTINGEDYGFIPTFHKHQRINGNEAKEPGKFPLTEEWEAILKQSGSNGEAPNCTGRERKGIGKEGNGEASNSDVKIFMDYAFQKFQEIFGEKLLIDGAKDGHIVKKLLGTYDLERLKGLWDVFMRLDDDWLNKAGRSIGIFKTQINKLLIDPGKKPSDEKRKELQGELKRAFNAKKKAEESLENYRERKDETNIAFFERAVKGYSYEIKKLEAMLRP